MRGKRSQLGEERGDRCYLLPFGLSPAASGRRWPADRADFFGAYSAACAGAPGAIGRQFSAARRRRI